MTDLIILGIETSGKTASVALMSESILLAQNTVYTSRTHSQVIMPMCTEMLRAAEKKLDDIGLLAVSIGPGSYTGLRIGIAAIKAMSFAKGIPCVGVSTLEGFAAQLSCYTGIIVPVMNARSDLIYTASFHSDGQAISRCCGDRIISRDELFAELKLTNKNILLTGDAAEELSLKYGYPASPITLRMQSAAGICLCALGKTPISADELQASYLQITKAEKDLREKNN